MKSVILKAGEMWDNFRSIYDPVGAARRKVARRLFWGYSAATETRKDEPFPADVQGDEINRMSRSVLRARARDLERNSPTIGAILVAFKNHVIGVGFNMQAMSDNEEFNRRIEELWREWCYHENCDYTKRQSLADILSMVLQRKLVDGGVFATFPIDKKRKVPLTIQLHEVDELDTSHVPNLKNGNVVVDGVELSSDGIEAAYWLSQTAPDGFTELTPKRIPAKDVLFVWSKNRTSQFREITELARVINATKDLQDYKEDVAMQQKTLASVLGFVTTENRQIAPGRITNSADGRERTEDVESGTIRFLNEGEHIESLTPTGQATEISNYIPIVQREIAADLGLSLEATSRNVERVNYSSARQNLLSDEVTYSRVRKELIEYFLVPLYRRFVEVCYLAGLLDGTGYNLNDTQYDKVVWLAATMGWIDPRKEAEANNLNLANGGKSFQQFCAEQGSDWRERIDEMAEVQEYAKSKGVNLAFNNIAIQNERKGENNEVED